MDSSLSQPLTSMFGLIFALNQETYSKYPSLLYGLEYTLKVHQTQGYEWMFKVYFIYFSATKAALISLSKY